MAVSGIRYICFCSKNSKIYLFPKNAVVCGYYSNKSQKPIKDVIQPPRKLKRFFSDNIRPLIQKSEKIASKKFPRAFNVYNRLKTGTSLFVSDIKVYVRVLIELRNGKKVGEFSLSELLIYSQLRKDIWLLTPLIFICLMPMGVWILLIAFLFPKYLLSYHFWTKQQKEKFYTQYLKKRLSYCPDILKSFNSHIEHIEEKNLKEKVLQMVQEIRKNQSQDGEKIFEVQPLFRGKPYHLDNLSLGYRWHLSKCLGLSVRNSQLKHDCFIFLNIDRAMRREGLLTLKDEEIERACYARGVDPMGLNREEKLKYLRQWVDITQKIDESSVSLLLHLPIFLAYTHPANRKHLTHKS